MKITTGKPTAAMIAAVADEASNRALSDAGMAKELHDYLDGVEQALRWVLGDGSTRDLNEVLERAGNRTA